MPADRKGRSAHGRGAGAPAGGGAGIWTAWLTTVLVAWIAASALVLLAPDVARRGFALLVHGDAGRLPTAAPEVVRHLTFLHGVLAAVMIGWSSALIAIVRGPFARGEGYAWSALAASLLLWFAAGTAWSLWLGVWRNALLNLVFLAVFALPLAATWRRFRVGRGAPQASSSKAA